MSRTSKVEKRRRSVSLKPESISIGSAISKRHVYGRTEKILRRNRKIWVRLANKRRRELDRQSVTE